MSIEENDYLQLSGLQHFLFCRRQWALIHIEQQWLENYLTVDGSIMHENAHNANAFEMRGDVMIAHSLSVSSSKLGISGQCDIVEFHRSNDGVTLAGHDGLWLPFLVEYKHGQPKDDNCDEAQLCAQAMCLEEMLCCHISSGALYYGKTRHRLNVEFEDQLRSIVETALAEMHQLYKRGHTPKVKVREKCSRCSLRNICLPELSKTLDASAYIDKFRNEE